jgi:phosphatidylglycerophosphatase A
VSESKGRLSWSQWRDPEVFLVCGFGSGFAPRAPGTFGSLAAVLIWWVALCSLPLWMQLLAIVVLTALGSWLTHRVQARYQVSDPGAIVIDEFAGQWIALLFAPMTLWGMLAGFALFRLFDVWKPWPVGALEKGVPGAFGVMVDDLAAGILALAVLQFTILAFQNI